MFAKEELEEVRRVVRLKRFEPLDLGLGLVGGGGGGSELELVIVIDFDLEIDIRVCLLEIVLRGVLARRSVSDKAHRLTFPPFVRRGRASARGCLEPGGAGRS